MPRFCANLTMLFTERPLLERFAAARAAGFDTVEILFPYDDVASDILDRLAQNELTLALINCPPPNYTGGARGFAAVPGGEERFRHDFRRAARYAKALGARHLHVMAGAAESVAARDTFIANLRWAASHAPHQSLTIEPINRVDMPGYFLSDYDLACDVLDAVAAPNLHLQFDTYHAHRITGDVLATWARVAPRVAHVQIGGFPGRNEPVGGEIDHPAFFAALRAAGYRGWVSGEYTPAGRTEDGLHWLRQKQDQAG
ncbi:MAG: TIM barrel protein [Limimaricola sp.]|uniref:hydroxypyruvate isomerase family protein n=1 Tax=Limimaricola sp. TaxID=2211665 RepID=UPI001D4BFF93|nr:TIM barrel protein [Limimaricola sp.]MBI1417633.1 TIM barrel protein [Limimaricola sp.]